MKNYEHILLALELNSACDEKIINKARDVVGQFGSKLTLIHAVECMSGYGAAYGASAGIDVEEQLQEEAKKHMQAVAANLSLDSQHQIVKIGPAKQIILDEAKREKADLIIVGSHGRHGVRLLLGSTANAILHGAECDVLAVRV